MKKTLIYILLALTISITIFGITTSAENISKNKNIKENNLIAVTAPTIPKPELLPGPSQATIEKEGGSARPILTETILPYFAVGLIGFIGGLSLLFLVIAGVRFVTAYGNEEAIEKAKKQAIYATVGLVIALLSYTIVTIIVNLRISGDVTERKQEAETEEATEEEEDKVYYPGEEEPDIPIDPEDVTTFPGEEDQSTPINPEDKVEFF
ncbi:hypothetical protein GF366_04575 [Candidatus Peregrinibacteria bacterium]|nr:hypothetical protein [Candidatus Peregrinibacteria bacterium]